jgi:hypothetical protein
MLEPLRANPAIAAPVTGPERERHTRVPSRTTLLWAAVVIGVIAVAIAWIELTDTRPAYDAFGWLVWGRQVLHWNLNTDGAPSWKPLTFLFTLPYALAGPNPQVWLWLLTSTAGALASSVFAARIAFRLTGPSPRRPWAAPAAAAFAAIAVLGISGYSELVLIANSDPLVVTLCLAAIDSHLSGRPRLAFVLLMLVALGRPEGWVFAGLYAIWMVRARSASIIVAVLGLAFIPLAWFLIPALTSHSWFISGDLAMNSVRALHGNKVVGVLSRFRGLYEWPMQVAVVYTLVLTVVRRDRVWLTLAGSALLWVAIEIALAVHGWSAVPRYLMEPAAVLIVLTAGAIGWTLANSADRAGLLVRWAPPVAFAALVVALVPIARSRARVAHGELHQARHAALAFHRLEDVIRAEGGARRIRTCGQPVTFVGDQSEVAWALGMNVGNVGFRPGKSIGSGAAVVLFRPDRAGWQVRTFNIRSRQHARCALRRDSKMGDRD